jgi:1-deoxyxylulose-5-phosphate synthase
MDHVRLGHTGLEVSRICLGMMTYGTPQWRPWVLDEEAARPLVRQAFELGINFFDTADVYSAGLSEQLLGRFLREFGKREECVVATKLFGPVEMEFRSAAMPAQLRPNLQGLSRKRIFHAVDHSLRRLGTDYIDLYQIHRLDPHTPMEETVEALHDVVKAGKVRYLGASSMHAWQFAKLQQIAREHGWTHFVSMQNHYNLVYREEEREMIPLCRDQGVALVPYSPLARGFLAGNRRPGDQDRGLTARAQTDDLAQSYYYRPGDFRIVEALASMTRAKGIPQATLAYAWLLHKGVSAAIVGASKPGQLEQAVAALDVRLAPEELRELEAQYEPHPVLGH